MKKLLFVLTLFITMFFVMQEETNASSSHIFIGANDELIFMNVDAFVEKGTTYVPVRIFEHFDVVITWDGVERSVLLEKDEQTVKIFVDSHTLITKDGNQLQFSSKLVQGNTMVPYRVISEYFQLNVSYIPTGPVARVTDERKQLSDQQFIEVHKKRMEEKKLQLHKEKNKKVAYLTFDDGPNKYTTTILNILKKHDAKATFFVLEPNVKRYPSVMKRKLQEGHALACHGVTHDKNKAYRNAQTIVNEMSQCKATVKNITNVTTNLVRVPYGSVPHMKAPYRAAMKNAGFKMWDWNVDSLDWKYSSNQIVNHSLAQVRTVEKRGEAPILLFHNLQSTTNAIEKIIVDMKKRGYTFKVLTEDMVPYDFWDKNLQSIKQK